MVCHIYCKNDIYFSPKRWQIDICHISLLLHNVNFVVIKTVEDHDTIETDNITNDTMECTQFHEDGRYKHIWKLNFSWNDYIK